MIELSKLEEKKENNGIREVENLVNTLKSIPCLLLKTGYRPTLFKFFYCSCDPEMKEPICEDCKQRCHKDHTTIKTEEIEAFCNCGMKCHNISSEFDNFNHHYVSKCFFHEISEVSQLNIYYENIQTQNMPICMFCYNFCLNEKKKEGEVVTNSKKVSYEKKILGQSSKVPECSCNHKNHREPKSLFRKLSQMGTDLWLELDFETLNYTQIINAILMSDRCLDNLFSISFFAVVETLFKKLLEPNFQFENMYNPTCEFNLSLDMFSKLANKPKRFLYFNNRMKAYIENFKMLEQMVERKFDFKQVVVWNIKQNMINLYLKFVFKNEFLVCPNLKIYDIEIFNPLQRLMKVQVTQDLKNPNFSLLESCLVMISKVNKIKDKQPETYLLIYRCYQVIKFLAKFCLFTFDYVQKLCQLNDEIIFNFSEAKKHFSDDSKMKLNMYNYQFQIMLAMIKSIRYLIFYYNDQLVESYLREEIALEKVNFYHMQSEISKHVSKNAINAMTYLRYFKRTEIGIDKDKDFHKILSQATKIIAMSMNYPDYYSVGLQRIMDKNKEIYLRYLAKNYDSKEKSFVEFAQNRTLELENSYQKYFEFKLNEQQLINNTINSVDEFFEFINMKNYNPNFGSDDLNDYYMFNNFGKSNIDYVVLNKEDKNKLVITRRKTNPNLVGLLKDDKQGQDQNNGNSKEVMAGRYKILLNSTYYVYSLVKVLKICESSYVSKTKKNDGFVVDLKLFDKVLKFLSYYVEENSDNCLVLLTSDFSELFRILNGHQISRFTELLEYCILSIMKSEFELSSNYTVLKIIKIIVKKSSNSSENLSALRTVINIIKLLTHVAFVNQEHTHDKLRRIVKMIYFDNPMFEEFKNYLILEGNSFSKNETDQNSMVEMKVGIKETTVDTKKVIQLDNNPELLGISINNNPGRDFNGYDLKLFKKTFIKYFEIVNYLFDGDATLNEMDFLQQILKPEEVPKILIKKDLELNFRTELLKFNRMVYIDVIINAEKIDMYRNLIINPPKPVGEEEAIDSKEVFKLYEELININQSEIGNMISLDSAILKYELKFFEVFIKNNENIEGEKVLDYIENGIILPLKVHLNKVMSIMYILDMEEYLKLYELVYFFLKMKEYIISHPELLSTKYQFFEIKNIFKNKFSLLNEKQPIVKPEFTPSVLMEVQKDLEDMSYQNFEILNFQNVYNIFEKHLDSLISKPTQVSLKGLFAKKNYIYSDKKIKKMREELSQAGMTKTNFERKVFDAIIHYANKKNELNGSSFLQILEEENTHFYMKYRNLIVRGLLFLISDPKSADRYRRMSLWGIFRLLQYDTANTQKCFLDLYEQRSDLFGLNNFIDVFFVNFVSLLFTNCNPSTVTMNYDYYIAMTIIKILKYLCEEHNEKFQKIFFQEIKFSYIPDEYQINYNNYNNFRVPTTTTPRNSNNTPKNIRIKKTILNNKLNVKIINQNMDRIQEDTNEDRQISMMIKDPNEHKFQPIKLFDFLLTILGKIIFLAEWDKVEQNDDEKQISYYYDMFFVIIELLIEMIQGTEKSNLEIILRALDGEEEAKHFIEFLNSVKPLIFRDKHNSHVLDRIRKDIMDFLMAFIEEKSTPTKLVTLMSNVLHPKQIVETIAVVMKKLYIKLHGLNKGYKEITFDNNMCDYFTEKYYSDLTFCESEEFELANRMYQYVKLLAVNEKYSHEDAIYIINSVQKYPISKVIRSHELRNKKTKNAENDFVNNADMIFDDNFYQSYFCVSFFEKITRTVLVQLESTDIFNEENQPVRVIFTLNPLTLYLSNHTKIEFYEKVNRDGRYIKLFSLMEKSDEFYDEIKYNSERSSPILRIINKINYIRLEFIAFLITLAVNIYMIAELNSEEISEGDHIHTPIINGIVYFNIVFNALSIILWFYAKFRLLYMIEKKKFLYRIQKEDFTLVDSLKVIFATIILRNEINGFLFNVTFCSIGVANPNFNFIYSLQLFAIINLSETLKNIIRSVTLKYKQLVMTLIFVVVLSYIFGSVAFFFFSEDFVFNIFDPKSPHVPSHSENTCGTMVYCFLSHLDYGMRVDGGMGEYLNKRASMTQDPNYYIGRFFYEWLFFITVWVILLSIIFGIIIDAFAELRDKYMKDEFDKNNICYICGATKEQLEKKSRNFHDHVENVHNMWTYFDYIIGLKFVDVQETNAINSYVIEQVELKQIAWFPAENDEEHEGEEENQDHGGDLIEKE